ncbi:DUF3039 domain-containing protein [Spiractinospora alimapuensis]|uniref:DUF3039 domain-containing protein n=1 Tax=Spiractinospora alimapuensis TaxID=2820884 RepID=UPI001F40C576|nr:DUF3039 domain-containing protein [Spiractinospora alimapuensis]QVQ54204.1 DUF3039 domain-containing protein [Spiractinospora alimapuensis]
MAMKILNKVVPESETRPDLSHGDDGDNERFAHYVQKDKITESAVTGNPVIALCGKVWVPNRDPKKFPICPDCKKIYEEMMG